jgi:outer membrane murein-binding lipoprotein Lpp
VAADPTRRVALAAAITGSLLLAGCKGLSVLGPLPKPGADVQALDHAIAAEELMIARYQAALGALTGPHAATAVIAKVLGEHQSHLDQLTRRLVLPPRLATASPAPSPTAPALPAGHRAVLTDLATAERAAVTRLTRQLLAAPPALAQLMASIGASEAAHAVVLAQAGGA